MTYGVSRITVAGLMYDISNCVHCAPGELYQIIEVESYVTAAEYEVGPGISIDGEFTKIICVATHTCTPLLINIFIFN